VCTGAGAPPDGLNVMASPLNNLAVILDKTDESLPNVKSDFNKFNFGKSYYASVSLASAALDGSYSP